MSSSATTTKKRLPTSIKFSENYDPNRLVSTPVVTKSPRLRKMTMSKTPALALTYASKVKEAGSCKKELKSKKVSKQMSVKKEHKERSTESVSVEVGEKAVERKKCEDDEGLLDSESERSLKMKTMRRIMLEEAMSSVPEPGAGRVMYLVRTFERLLSIPKDEEEKAEEEVKKKVVNWALPGLQNQQPPKTELSDCSCLPLSSLVISASNTEDFGTEMCGDDRLSPQSDEADEMGRNRRNSTGSSGKSWDNKLRVTRLRPFKLRTEQRGRFKEEHFIKKVKEMLLEEEKRRIPVAQGLPWTTDEPECLMKPHVKDPTEPLDVILRSDVRAAERAKFDHYVAENLSFFEQIKLERERQQKLEEEEELKRLRKDLVPKAQPMPYFDNPFVPSRSSKPLTVPKEPKFHLLATKELEAT